MLKAGVTRRQASTKESLPVIEYILSHLMLALASPLSIAGPAPPPPNRSLCHSPNARL